MSIDHRKRSVKENFCDKISCAIWTQIHVKENGNSVERNTINAYMYIHVSLHVLSGMNLFEAYNAMCVCVCKVT